MDFQQISDFITNDLPQILQALLSVVGGLKLMSRYTPWAWDDRLLEAVEKPLKRVRAILPKKPKKLK